MSSLRASLKQARDDNAQLKLEVHALRQGGDLVANDSLADLQITPSQNPRLLANAFDAKVQLERELARERRRNSELEKMNRAYQKSINELARKRAEDRHIIETWRQKLEGLKETDELEENFLEEEDHDAPASSALKRRRIESTRARKIMRNDTNLFVETAPSNSDPREKENLGESAIRMLSKSEEEEGETSEKVGFAKPASIVNPTTAPSTSVFDMPNQLHTDSLDMEARGIPNLVSSPVFSSSPNKSKRTGQGASVTIKQEEISDVENDFEEIQTYKRKPLVKSSPPIEFARPYQQDQYNIDDEATYSPSRAKNKKLPQDRDRLEVTENICIPQTETGPKKIPALMPPTVLPRKKNMRIFDENDIDSQLLVVAADHNNGATDSITTKNKTRLLKEIRSTSIPIAMQQAIPTTSIGANKTRQTAGTAGKTHPQGTKAQRRQELHDRIERINNYHELVE